MPRRGPVDILNEACARLAIDDALALQRKRRLATGVRSTATMWLTSVKLALPVGDTTTSGVLCAAPLASQTPAVSRRLQNHGQAQFEQILG